MSDSQQILEEIVLAHNRDPRGFQHQPQPTSHQAHGYNPECDDEFTVYLHIEQGRIVEAGFDGVGCSISMAAASLMMETLKGKRVEEAKALYQKLEAVFDAPTIEGRDLSPLMESAILAGVREQPSRIKCALLPWAVMEGAIRRTTETLCTEGRGEPECPKACEMPAFTIPGVTA